MSDINKEKVTRKETKSEIMNIETSKPKKQCRVINKLKYESITKIDDSDNNTWKEGAVEPELKVLLQQQPLNLNIDENKIILIQGLESSK